MTQLEKVLCEAEYNGEISIETRDQLLNVYHEATRAKKNVEEILNQLEESKNKYTQAFNDYSDHPASLNHVLEELDKEYADLNRRLKQYDDVVRPKLTEEVNKWYNFLKGKSRASTKEMTSLGHGHEAAKQMAIAKKKGEGWKEAKKTAKDEIKAGKDLRNEEKKDLPSMNPSKEESNTHEHKPVKESAFDKLRKATIVEMSIHESVALGNITKEEADILIDSLHKNINEYSTDVVKAADNDPEVIRAKKEYDDLATNHDHKDDPKYEIKLHEAFRRFTRVSNETKERLEKEEKAKKEHDEETRRHNNLPAAERERKALLDKSRELSDRMKKTTDDAEYKKLNEEIMALNKQIIELSQRISEGRKDSKVKKESVNSDELASYISENMENGSLSYENFVFLIDNWF